ncbi:MAG: hypothetical protein CME44_10450 [Haliea sp.]|nr:hypothetical protein [Haliea sp.]MAY93849.1 hypothetical protein [Haliea sp.]MBK41608.1 hypothetical protein [Haliea sp.]
MATTEKWQGRPHLAFAIGVGRFQYWHMLNASVRTFLDATVSDDRVHLRTTTVPHSLGTALSNPSRFQGFVHAPQLLSGATALRQPLFLQLSKYADGQRVLPIPLRR